MLMAWTISKFTIHWTEPTLDLQVSWPHDLKKEIKNQVTERKEKGKLNPILRKGKTILETITEVVKQIAGTHWNRTNTWWFHQKEGVVQKWNREKGEEPLQHFCAPKQRRPRQEMRFKQMSERKNPLEDQKTTTTTTTTIITIIIQENFFCFTWQPLMLVEKCFP